MNNSFKILMICKSLPWRFKGGIQTHTWDLSRALVAKGHQVTVLTGGMYSQNLKQYHKENVEIIEIPFFPGRYFPGIGTLVEELSFNLEVKKWIKKHADSYEIIHAQGRSGYLLYQIPEIHPKLVNTVHGLTSIEATTGDRKSLSAKLHMYFSQKWEIKLLQAAKGAIAVSNDLKKSLLSFCVNPTNILQVIPNGVDVMAGSKQVVSMDQVIDRFVFVGRLHPVKGLGRLIKAIGANKRILFLDIIGSGPEENNLKQLAQDLGLEQQIRFLGEHDSVAIHYMLPYYKGLVLPSLYESQGIVLLEAHVHGVPVIASDLAPIRETVTSKINGLLCDPERPEEYVQAMEYLLDNPTEARNMGLNGLDIANKEYSWSSVADKTVAFYSQIAS